MPKSMDMLWQAMMWHGGDSEKLASVGTPHPGDPLQTISRLLNQIRRDVWDLLSQEELEPSDFLPTDEVTGLGGSVCEMPAQ